MEQWKTCDKYTNYEVSDRGRIRNSKTGHIMKTVINKRGYEQVSLYHGNRVSTELVHRLVAGAYLGDGNGLDVGHKNEKRTDNIPDNLEYRTRSETVREGFNRGRIPSRQVKVRVVETGEIFNSISECANSLGLNICNVSQCVTGVAYSHRGYHFEKVE